METNKNTSPVIEEKDRNAISLDLMNRMKLHGMASAFRESLNSTMAENMTIEPSSPCCCRRNGTTAPTPR